MAPNKSEINQYTSDAIKYANTTGSATTKFRKNSKSIVNAAKGNIFEFPVFVSSSTPLEYATATNSLLEQVYASYLQMAISINPVVDSDAIKHGGPFSAFKSDTNKYLEHTDMTYAHDACHAVYDNGECVTEFNMISATDKDYQIINEYCDYQPLSEFSHYFQEVDYPAKKQKKNGKRRIEDEINDMPVNADETDVVEEKDNENEDVTTSPSNTDTDNKNEYDEEKRAMAKEKHSYDIYKTSNDGALSAKKLASYDREQERAEEKHKLDVGRYHHDTMLTAKKINSYDREQARAEEKHAHDTKIKAPQFIDDSKVQKLNTMKPLLMSVNLGIMDKNGSVSRPMEYVVGVKTHCRIIDADILPEVAEYPIKEMNKLSRKAKWRAGELKFFKDIVFKIKQKKQTAVDSRDPKRKWYRRLYELAHSTGDAPSHAIISNNGILKSIGNKQTNGVIPNATIIITKSDIDNIKSQTKIDLLDGNTAVKFCNELFLISLVVIDTDQESIKILLPDLHDDFEIHSLASVNKQLAMLDTAGAKTRDILKVLG